MRKDMRFRLPKIPTDPRNQTSSGRGWRQRNHRLFRSFVVDKSRFLTSHFVIHETTHEDPIQFSRSLLDVTPLARNGMRRGQRFTLGDEYSCSELISDGPSDPGVKNPDTVSVDFTSGTVKPGKAASQRPRLLCQFFDLGPRKLSFGPAAGFPAHRNKGQRPIAPTKIVVAPEPRASAG
jgi:hypothetical protein